MALLVTQRQLLRQALHAIHNPPVANAMVKVSKHNQPEKAKMVKELVPFLQYLYKKYLDAKIMETNGDFVILSLSEDINIPINIGDTVLGGKFKNKRIVVKSIGKNEKGDITINDKPFLKYRLSISEANAVSGGKIHKFITGNNLTLQGKKHSQIEFEVLGTDNKSQLVKLRILFPKNLAGQELNVPFKTIRRGPFIKTDTKGQFEGTINETITAFNIASKLVPGQGDKFKDLVHQFITDNGLDYNKVYKFIEKGPRSTHAGFMSRRFDLFNAINANPNNAFRKRLVVRLKESKINEIPMADLKQIDQFADKQLNPVDVVLTDKHFFDRLNDPRNGKEISNAELIGFFKRLGKHKKEFVEFLEKYNSVVAVDDRTNINIPFMKQSNKAIAKTVMRKKDFKSPDKKLGI